MWGYFLENLKILFYNILSDCHYSDVINSLLNALSLKKKKGKSTQYKKLVPNTLTVVRILKFEILQTIWKNKTKKHQNTKSIAEKLKTKSLGSSFYFFMWFARFQVLICEPQSIWRKLLLLSWLYIKHSKAFPSENFQNLS